MISLQSLAPSHFPALLRINEQNYPAVGKLSLPELRRLSALDGSHWVAWDEKDGVKGYLLTFTGNSFYDGDEFRYFQANVREPFIYVDQVAVAQNALRAGIGRLFYESVFERAQRTGAHSICCEVNTFPANPQSMAFHLSLGFAPIGEGTVNFGWKVAFLKKTLALEKSD